MVGAKKWGKKGIAKSNKEDMIKIPQPILLNHLSGSRRDRNIIIPKPTMEIPTYLITK